MFQLLLCHVMIMQNCLKEQSKSSFKRIINLNNWYKTYIQVVPLSCEDNIKLLKITFERAILKEQLTGININKKYIQKNGTKI